ncbi:MAG: hypothetical protein OXN81_07375 [Alphaproteobacteria bacterium]|nr:hypothetical protein [Alphaproteobacteria bacterium]
MTKGWQEQALADAMAASRGMISGDRMTLRLANPAEEARLDDIILSHLWPGAERGLFGTQWTFWAGTEERLRDRITTGYGRHTQRSIKAIIADPQRPIGPGQSPPWYCRIEIDVQTHGYHLHQDTILSFPDSFSWTKLQQLLKEPELQGCPPELSWSSPHADRQGEFTMSFTGGGGITWLPIDLDVVEQRDGAPMAHAVQDYGDLLEWNAARMAQAADETEKLVRQHVKIAQAMDALSTAWQSTKRFHALHDAVLAVYEAW